jgi:dihydropteroate synthase
MLKRVDSRSDFEKLCLKVGSTKEGIAIMKEKSSLYYFYINSLKTPACNILKQELLSIGAEVAVGRGVINCASKTSDALIVVNKKQLKLAIKKLSKQPFGLKELAKSLKEHLSENSFDVKIMCVINANDDSFYQKSSFSGSQAVKKISIMIKEGANIIDIGGVSSRPGSEYVGEEEEFKRVKPIIDEVYSERLFEKAMFSLDSFSPKCLRYALDRGFKIVNDITALESDEVAKLAGEYKAKVVLMHKK